LLTAHAGQNSGKKWVQKNSFAVTHTVWCASARTSWAFASFGNEFGNAVVAKETDGREWHEFQQEKKKDAMANYGLLIASCSCA
jgi:hypothetical protein